MTGIPAIMLVTWPGPTYHSPDAIESGSIKENVHLDIS